MPDPQTPAFDEVVVKLYAEMNRKKTSIHRAVELAVKGWKLPSGHVVQPWRSDAQMGIMICPAPEGFQEGDVVPAGSEEPQRPIAVLFVRQDQMSMLWNQWQLITPEAAGFAAPAPEADTEPGLVPAEGEEDFVAPATSTRSSKSTRPT